MAVLCNERGNDFSPLFVLKVLFSPVRDGGVFPYLTLSLSLSLSLLFMVNEILIQLKKMY